MGAEYVRVCRRTHVLSHRRLHLTRLGGVAPRATLRAGKTCPGRLVLGRPEAWLGKVILGRQLSRGDSGLQTQASDQSSPREPPTGFGGVKLDGIKIEDPSIEITLSDNETTVQIGKRKFYRVKTKD